MRKLLVLAFGVFAFLTITTQFSLADSDNVVDLLKKVTNLNQHDSSSNAKSVTGQKGTQFSGDLFADTVPKEAPGLVQDEVKKSGHGSSTSEGL